MTVTIHCKDNSQWFVEALISFNNAHPKCQIDLEGLFGANELGNEVKVDCDVLKAFADYIFSSSRLSKHFEARSTFFVFSTPEKAVETVEVYNKNNPDFWIDSTNLGQVELEGEDYHFVDIQDPVLFEGYSRFLEKDPEFCESLIKITLLLR